MGTNYSGLVHLWALGTGKKIMESHPASILLTMPSTSGTLPSSSSSILISSCPAVHSMSFSPCGMVLVMGGDDCIVQLWDVGTQTLTMAKKCITQLVQAYAMHCSLLLDLRFTPHNALLALGKLVTPVPMVAMNTSGMNHNCGKGN